MTADWGQEAKIDHQLKAQLMVYFLTVPVDCKEEVLTLSYAPSNKVIPFISR